MEILVVEERRKPEYPEKKPLGAKERTNNKLNPHMLSTPGFEPGPFVGRLVLSSLRATLAPT